MRHARSLPHVHVAARRVLLATAVTLVAGAIELEVSRTAGSLFLAADAAHLLAHLGIFVVLLLPTGSRHEGREDILTCLVLLLVIGIAIEIALHSLHALIAEEAAPPPGAMVFSLLGLAANLITAWLFRDPAERHWSFKAALAHELSDAALTIAGLVGAAAIALFQFRWVDPGLSLAIAIWLLAWASRLLARRIRGGRSAWTAH